MRRVPPTHRMNGGAAALARPENSSTCEPGATDALRPSDIRAVDADAAPDVIVESMLGEHPTPTFVERELRPFGRLWMERRSAVASFLDHWVVLPFAQRIRAKAGAR